MECKENSVSKHAREVLARRATGALPASQRLFLTSPRFARAAPRTRATAAQAARICVRPVIDECPGPDFISYI